VKFDSDAAAYRARADLHRPVDEPGYAIAVLQLAAQGLRERDIAAHLRLDPGAVRRLLYPPNGERTMKPDPTTSAAAKVGGPTDGGRAERDAAQAEHLDRARSNVMKRRRPGEILTADEAETLRTSRKNTP